MEALLAIVGDLRQWGAAAYWLVFLIPFLESFVFTGAFVPGTVVVIILGGFAAHGMYEFWHLAAFCTAGAVIGDGVSYELGTRGQVFLRDRPWLRHQVERAQPFFRAHQSKSILIGRFVGPVRPFVPFVAGIAGMHRISFYSANVLSAVVWALFHLGLGYVFGTAWKVALLWSTRAGLFLLIFFVMLAVLLWLWRWVAERGRGVFATLWAWIATQWSAFIRRPAVHAWILRHPRIIRAIAERTSMTHFIGLPLSLLLLAIFTSLVALSHVVEDYVTGDMLATVDVQLANLLLAFRTRELLSFFYEITLLAQWQMIVAVGVFLTFILWRQRERFLLLAFWVAVAGSEAVTTLAKVVFHRPRPDGLLPAIFERTYAFPSGHATAVVAFYGTLAYIVIRTRARWRVKVGAAFLMVLLIFLVDVSRLYLGVHYLSDVLSGNLVGFTILLFAVSAAEWLTARMGRVSAESACLRTPFLGIAVVMVITMAFMTAFLHPRWSGLKMRWQDRGQIQSWNVLRLFDEALPRVTETLIGTEQEPVNIIIVGERQCLVAAFGEAGWDLADNISLQSSLQLVRKFLLDEPYIHEPMIPAFYDTHPHDIAFEQFTQKRAVHTRHHIRLWQTRYRTPQGAVFVGAASFDIGTKWGIAHSIAPAIDEERDNLVASLRRTGQIAHVETVPFTEPIVKNADDADFYTDGRVVYLILNGCSGT
ncbi:MAG: LssY C-terminal domain-containing protein [Candidatus Peribacteraceae bacterium]|nr:LssY C-terminal domain-containing protein [Candidatus Peribacteraceae bacterium]